jgi:putative FmdB family regulatory protein
MPIYEYQCVECGEQFEKLVRSSAPADSVTCPKCGSKNVQKKLSVFGVGGGHKTSSASAPASSCGPT